MGLLDAWRGITGGNGRTAGRRGRGAQLRRRVVSAVMGPVLAAGTSLVPAAATAAVVVGVAAVAVAKATSAHASSGPSVAVVLVNGEGSAPETAVLTAAGYSVTTVTPSALASMSQATFQGYAAVVIGDSSTSGTCSTAQPSTATLGSQWEGWVTGNVAVLGTAPARPGTSGANALIADAVGYAARQPATGSATGLYLSLNCGYASSPSGTAVSLLNGVDSIGTAGGLTVNGSLACTDAGTVNKWETAAAGTFGGFTSTSLGTGSTGFPSPSCPVEEAFDTWPAMFAPAGYDTGADATKNFTASDGVSGQPYILLGAKVSAATAALAPSAGGEVPAGTTAGGANPAAPGVNQPTAGDPVNTESGDFTQSDTDFSIPGYGPSLSFTRSYDSAAAQAQTQAGAPGPLGYGWTDNWATSLMAGQTLPGDIYTIAGMQTDTGQGGPPAGAPLNTPSTLTYTSAGIYIADTGDNRVEEIPSATGTQWGVPMTAGDIYTIAGSPAGTSGASGNGTPASSTLLDQPTAVTTDAAGDLFISDTGNCRVTEIAHASGTQWGTISMTVNDMYSVAGVAGDCGSSSNGTAATSAWLNQPGQLAVGPDGSLYIADNYNNTVADIPAASGTHWGLSMTADDMYMVAGSGGSGTSGDGGPAVNAKMTGPFGLTLDSSGDLLIADSYNNRVQEVPAANTTQWGLPPMTADDMYTIAGSSAGTSGTGGDSGPGTSAFLSFPSGLTVGDGGQLYIADSGNNRLQELAATAHTERGLPMTVGDIYTIAGSASGSQGFSGNGGPATSALLWGPQGAAVDSSGNVYIADTYNNGVREVSASSGTITQYAGGLTSKQVGDFGPALGSGLNSPDGVATDSQGDVFIADTYSNRVQEIAVSTHVQYGIHMTAGDVYTVAGSATGQSGVSGDGGPATSALLYEPYDIAVDSSGNLYIADGQGMRIQEVSASTGNISTIAGSASGACGNSGQGGPATSALFQIPSAIAVDAAGDVLIEDAENNQVYDLPKTSGTYYGTPMTAGDLYTIAGSTAGTAGSTGDGGAGTAALLSDPDGLAVDPAGNVYIADAGNNRIQELAATVGTQHGQSMTAGHIYTVAGSAAGTSGNTGDGGPAASALLHTPGGLSLDSAGDLYIIDYANNRVREVAAANGTQWGQSMTAGDIYNIGGSSAGTAGETGDGGPATSALISSPAGIATDPAGDVFLTDSGYSRLREITATSNPVTPVNPAGTAVTVTQAGGAQVTFAPQSGGSCTAPWITAGGYCVLPADTGATLTYSSGSYAFSPAPGTDTWTYNSAGQLTSDTSIAGDKLTVTYSSPAPGGTVTGNGTCPSSAASCETIMAASGRALVLGWNTAGDTGQVTSVTDPMNRTWTYAYASGQLTSATDPMTNKTSYTYGQGSTGNPLLANALLTVTTPNAQPGGPDAGDKTVNVYDSTGRVTQQTDPMGFRTTFNFCVSAASGDCMNAATGTGLVSVADPDGNTTVYDYQQGTLAAETQLTGTTVTSEQDYTPDTTSGGTAGGTMLDTSSTDGDGNTTTTAYNASGNPTSSTSPGANGTPATTTTGYTNALQADNCDSTAEAASTATCSQDPGPTPVAPGGTITPPSTAPPLGLTWTLYDNDGNEIYATTGVYSPTGTYQYSRTTYQLYKNNSVTLGSNHISCTNTPPTASLPCASINADGVVTQLKYDSQGDLTQSSTPDGNAGGELATITYTYDGDGEQQTKVAPDGNLTGANAGNYTTTTAWNSDGKQSSVTQGNGTGYTDTPRTTSYGYDGDGNQTTVKDARTYTTTTTYNADDKPTLVTDPDGNAALTCYDGDGNTAQTVPATGVAANGLTAASCPTSYPSGYGTSLASDATVSTYNGQGQVTQQTTPAPAGQSGSETTSYTYDLGGNVLTTTAPPATNGGSNQITTTTYTTAGQVATETTGTGSSASTVSYCYDPNGDKTSVVYADGNTGGTAACSTSSPWTVAATPQASYQTTYAYDSAAELVSTTTPKTTAAPSGATTTSTYDAGGNMVTRKDPNGVTTTWTYGTDGKVIGITYSGGTAHAVTYGYDAAGQRTSMTDAAGSSSYIFDSFGELTSDTNGASQVIRYGYNPDGQVSGITYPLPSSASSWDGGNTTVNYGYDNADMLTSVTDFNGHQIIIGNTADGLPKSETLGSTGDTISTSYDNTDAPSAITLKNSSATLQSFTYSDSPAGTVLSETDTPSSPQSPAAYAYDNQGRVTSMTPGTGTQKNYAFDASSNLTTLPNGATASYDNAGELTSQTLSGGTTSYTYDADGQQLTSAQGGSTVASGTWNGAGQLATYSDSAANMTAATYDGNGERASTTITPSGGSAATNGYVWNTVPQVPELLMDSSAAYIFDGGIAPVEQVNLSSGAITYLVTDSLGSVRGCVNSSGALTGTTSYDAWGNPETTGGLTATSPFGYAGGYTDQTGFIYLINRYYQPSTGQFISVDPAIVQTLQPYEYAGGNPVISTDPNGLWKATVCSHAGFWTRTCTTYYDLAGTVRLYRNLTDAIELGQEGCDILDEMGQGEAGVLCQVLETSLYFVRWWVEHELKNSGGLGIHIRIWYWRTAWWWFGWHHGPWLPDWGWIYPYPFNT